MKDAAGSIRPARLTDRPALVALSRQVHEGNEGFRRSLGEAPLHGVFIRAPVVSEVGPGVEILARDADGRPIAVRQGRVMATAFHPELTPDRRLHRLLVELIGS